MKIQRINLGGITISGAATSAAAVNGRHGVAASCRVRVEGGRMVYWDEIIQSVNKAYNDLCERKPTKYRKYYV